MGLERIVPRLSLVSTEFGNWSAHAVLMGGHLTAPFQSIELLATTQYLPMYYGNAAGTWPREPRPDD